MTAIQAAAFWVGVNALFLIFLSVRVGAARAKHKVNLGDGGNDAVNRAIRTHGNYTEYAPMALIGLLALGLLNAAPLFVHIAGALFLFARLSHYLGLGAGVWAQGRLVGTLLTMVTLLMIAGGLIYYAVSG